MNKRLIVDITKLKGRFIKYYDIINMGLRYVLQIAGNRNKVMTHE